MDFTQFQSWFISVLIYIYYDIQSSQSNYRFRDDLEECGDFGGFWSLLSAELHRCVRCIAMNRDFPTVKLSPCFNRIQVFELAFQCRQFEVNQYPVIEIIPGLLKIGQSVSREEAVKEMKDCRSTVHPWCGSMVHPWCGSTVMPEYGPSIFYDRLKPRSNHKLPEYLWTT